MHPIKDSVHDYISLTPVAADLLDTPAMQRLRHVKQLATVRLVYPSASHTRFEHSLGVYHLASRALDSLGVDGDRAAHVRAAALLHDVGHGPYGHQTERVIRRRTDRHHDEIEHLLDGTEVAATLVAHGLSPERVAALVRGDGALGTLVSGVLDVDRMDYLVRDAHHTGVPYGTIDHGRLIGELRLRDGELVLGEGTLATAESLLLARSLMNGIVYRHHVSRIAGAMLDRACERLLESGVVDIERFARMADHDLLVALGDHVPEFGRRLERRDLYKRAVWVGRDAVPAELVDAGYEEWRRLERAVADAADVEQGEVILDVPPGPRVKEADSRLVVGGEVRRLDAVSELVPALRAVERERWRLGVYCPAEATAAVAETASRTLGVGGSG